MPVALIIDDEPAILRLLSFALRNMGCEPVTAPDAEVALEELENRKPDIIIADVRLPGMDGVEFTQQVKSDSRFAQVPVLLISAFGEPRVNGGHRADQFLAKPFDIDSLEDAVKPYL